MEQKRYTIVPKQTIDTWIDTIGNCKVPEEVTEILSEDATYHIRELIHKSIQVMKHSKRSFLTVDDVNAALKESDTDPIFGHGGIETQNFKGVPYKEGSNICYLDEKDINLRETALESVYPLEAGETTVKASWLVLEGYLCGSNQLRDDRVAQLNEAGTNYLQNITKALIGNGDQLRKVALEDLRMNKKLQIIIPHLVSFCSSQIKHHTGKKTFTVIAGHILTTIGALVKNASVILTPYLIQLAKIMLFILMEAKIDVKDWQVKNKAAEVLASLSRRHSNSSPDVREQLLKSYSDTLNGTDKQYGQLYGAVSGIKELGLNAVCIGLYPKVSEKLKIIQKSLVNATTSNESVEILLVINLLAETLSILYQPRFHSRTKSLVRKSSQRLSHLYSDLVEAVGESFVLRCTPTCVRVTETPNVNSSTSTHNNALNTTKHSTTGNVESDDVKKTSTTIQVDDSVSMTTIPQQKMEVPKKEHAVKCSVGSLSFVTKWSARELNKVNVFSIEDNVTSLNRNGRRNLTTRKPIRGSHQSYLKKVKKTILPGKPLYLPIF